MNFEILIVKPIAKSQLLSATYMFNRIDFSPFTMGRLMIRLQPNADKLRLKPHACRYHDVGLKPDAIDWCSSFNVNPKQRPDGKAEGDRPDAGNSFCQDQIRSVYDQIQSVFRLIKKKFCIKL